MSIVSTLAGIMLLPHRISENLRYFCRRRYRYHVLVRGPFERNPRKNCFKAPNELMNRHRLRSEKLFEAIRRSCWSVAISAGTDSTHDENVFHAKMITNELGMESKKSLTDIIFRLLALTE